MKTFRVRHHAFAHHLVPALFASDPEGFIAAASAAPHRLMRRCWNAAGPWWLRLLGGPVPWCQVRSLGQDDRIALIAMPPPQRAPEAYFVALAYLHLGEGAAISGPRARGAESLAGLGAAQEPASVRVITIEQGTDNQGKIITFLGEAIGHGEGHQRDHLNLGPGCEPRAEAFLQRVRQLVSEAPEP